MLLYDRASIQPSAQDSTYGMLKQLYYGHIFLTPLLLFSVRLVRLVNICLCLYNLTLALRLIRSTISSSYRLETSFGVTGDALKWIASYLSARSQRIMINGILSDLICHLEFLKGHASDHFCSLLMRASCSRLSKTICLMRMRTLTTLSFICRSSQTVQWIRRKQEVLWKDVSGP